MVNSPYFRTHFLPVSGRTERDLADREAFSILIAVDGVVKMKTGQDIITLSRGETCLIPASLKGLVLESDGAKLLEVTL